MIRTKWGADQDDERDWRGSREEDGWTPYREVWKWKLRFYLLSAANLLIVGALLLKSC